MPPRSADLEPPVSEHREALAWANTQVGAARYDPAVRVALMERLFHGPTAQAS